MPYTETLFNPDDYWWFSAYHIPQLWNMGLSGAGIKVAVLDSGVSLPHPDLNMDPQHVLDVTNATTNGLDTSDGHGTHCAGIIQASYNGLGITGIAYNASVYSIKIVDDDTGPSPAFMTAGLRKAIELGVDIISLSQASQKDNADVRKAIADALAQGIVVIAAASNKATGTWYPASYEGVLSVAAVDQQQVPLLPQQESRRDLFAPGRNIYSTDLDMSYKQRSGSSQATPYVAAVCALLLEAFKKKDIKYTPAGIRNRILQRATENIAGVPLIDPFNILKDI